MKLVIYMREQDIYKFSTRTSRCLWFKNRVVAKYKHFVLRSTLLQERNGKIIMR